MGEISVLLVAATGVASLVFLSRRTGAIFRAQDAQRDRAVWGGSTDPMAALRLPAAGRTRATPRASRQRAVEPGAGPRVVAGRTHARAATTLGDLRGRRPAAVPHDDRLLGVPAVQRPQRPRRRVRGGPRHGHRARSCATSRAVGTSSARQRRCRRVCCSGWACSCRPGSVSSRSLVGGSVLESWIWDVHLPVIGDLHLVTSLFFDVGVYLVVVGLVLDILRSLGAEIDRRAETGEDPVGAGASERITAFERTPAGGGADDRHEPQPRPRRHDRRAVRVRRVPAARAQPVARAHRRHPHRQRREPAVPRRRWCRWPAADRRRGRGPDVATRCRRPWCSRPSSSRSA